MFFLFGEPQTLRPKKGSFRRVHRSATWAMVLALALIPVSVVTGVLGPQLYLPAGDEGGQLYHGTGVLPSIHLVSSKPKAETALSKAALSPEEAPVTVTVANAFGKTTRVTISASEAKALIQLLQAGKAFPKKKGETPPPSAATPVVRKSSLTSASTHAVKIPTTLASVRSPSEPNPSAPLAGDSHIPWPVSVLYTFIVATSLVVVLMMYAGISLVRAGSVTGGAKVDVFGMKIDAKGTGLGAIGCGAIVMMYTFHDLIEAVVKIAGH